MKRNIKIITAAVAVIALSALSASSAFGTKGEWDWAWSHTNSKVFGLGSQVGENVFTVSGGTVKCKKAEFHGVAEGTTAETLGGGLDYAVHIITATPTYSECTAFGQNATVTTNGCTYDLTPTSATGGSIQITCPAGKSITVKANTAGCTVTVGAQTPKTPTLDLKAEGEGTARDVLITSTVEGITYTSSGGICGASGTNGKYTGSVTLKGYTDEAHTKQIGVTLAETIS